MIYKDKIPEEEYKYIISKDSTVTVVEIIYNNEKYLVDPRMVFKSDDELLSKDDAMYELFSRNMRKGKPLSNYKKSKYYKMYCKRAQVENPEFFIL